MPPTSFRRARDADLDRLLEIHVSAYPDPRGHEARRRNFLSNPWGELAELWVAEREGALVAHAFLFPFEMGFGGARVRAAGVASVAVAPEARGTSVAAALLAHLHAEARARGDAVSVLHAFRQGFYARHGYAPVTPWRRLRFHPAAVPEEWRLRARSAGTGAGVCVRAATGADLDAIVACYDRALLRGTGMIARRRASWEARAANERRTWLVATCADGVRGYVSWSLVQAESHARTTLAVHDLVADEDGDADVDEGRDAVRRALLGALGAQRDQVTEIALDVADGDPLDRALTDMDRGRHGTEEVEHALGEIVAGPMVRILDVARALGARGYATDGTLDVIVDGRGGSDGSGKRDGYAHRLVAHGGRGTATPLPPPSPTGRERAADGETAVRFRDEAALAAVLYGALSASQASRLGWASGTATAIAAADALLALPPYFARDAF